MKNRLYYVFDQLLNDPLNKIVYNTGSIVKESKLLAYYLLLNNI